MFSGLLAHKSGVRVPRARNPLGGSPNFWTTTPGTTKFPQNFKGLPTKRGEPPERDPPFGGSNTPGRDFLKPTPGRLNPGSPRSRSRLRNPMGKIPRPRLKVQKIQPAQKYMPSLEHTFQDVFFKPQDFEPVYPGSNPVPRIMKKFFPLNRIPSSISRHSSAVRGIAPYFDIVKYLSAAVYRDKPMLLPGNTDGNTVFFISSGILSNNF